MKSLHKQTTTVIESSSGLTLLNLGCGKKAHQEWNNLDSSVSIRIAQNKVVKSLLTRFGFLHGDRLKSINELPESILRRDLSKGIPYANNTFDMVYHSHLLEHLSLSAASVFLEECKRVLKPKGIIRIVVPDFEKLCNDYVDMMNSKNDAEEVEMDAYWKLVNPILEQMVRRESAGSSDQKLWRRKLENLILGDATKRGETHQWMHDRVSLSNMLARGGFIDITLVKYNKSSLETWNIFCLDKKEDGNEYKPKSIYIEATAPEIESLDVQANV
jgi:SAM-dependent methyltransferase